jgi:hypothetical protein
VPSLKEVNCRGGGDGEYSPGLEPGVLTALRMLVEIGSMVLLIVVTVVVVVDVCWGNEYLLWYTRLLLANSSPPAW